MTQPAAPIKHNAPPRGRDAKKAAYSTASASSRTGLNPEQVAASRAAHGSNVLSARKHKSFGRQFLSNLGDPVIRILLCALGVNLIFCFRGGDWFETAGIAIAVSLATLISTLSECGSEAAFAKLSEACGHVSCRVRRIFNANEPDGSVCEIPVEDVVVGDVVLLGAGDMIPADGILLSGELRVDQSAMTGESREVDKFPAASTDTSGTEPLLPHTPHALFRGCVVVSGNGLMQVTSVGDGTFLGEISREVQLDTRESPLKMRLGKLAKQISRLGYVAAALVTLVSLFHAFILDSGFDPVIISAKLSDLSYVWQQVFQALTLGLTVIVMAVPEGLPMMIAVVLSSNMKRMVKDQVLVRKPAGIEAAGSMNVLFTDKTGTLTEGHLGVAALCDGALNRYSSLSDLKAASPALFAHVADACSLNTESMAGRSGDRNELCALGGNATDRALLNALLDVSPSAPTTPVAYQIPFDSAKKFAAVQIHRAGRPVWLIKGAPEKLIPFLHDALPDHTPLRRPTVEQSVREWTGQGRRVLLFAESTAPLTVADVTAGRFGHLSLVALVALEDRIRAEAPDSVQALKKAGIHVVMITGDNKDTASVIAKRCGILDERVDTALTGDELSRLSDLQIKELLPRIGVIARALPTDKSRLVRIAQEADLVVGMTGDGINDAPALKRADIGFAMGAGTQVAKEAGDVIIMDNNLASIARAVLYGRTIFKSIRKFITLQLTMNFCAVGVSMLGPFIGVEAPVTVVQMLWINLIMDTLGGLAFAGEAPLASYMNEPPKRRDEPILNGYMIHEIALLGSFTVLLCLGFWCIPSISGQFRRAGDDIYRLTAFFALFIFASVFNCFNARTDRLRALSGLAQNRAFIGIMTAILIIQILFVYLGGAVLRTAPLTPRELAVTSALALLVFPAEWTRKFLWKLGGKSERY